MTFDFYTEYCHIHQAVYGRIPCTREQWEQWCMGPRLGERQPSDIDFDHAKERDGDAQ